MRHENGTHQLSGGGTVSGCPGLRLIGEGPRRAGAVSFPAGDHPQDAATLLDMQGMALRRPPLRHAVDAEPWHRRVQSAPRLACYNHRDDVDALLCALQNSVTSSHKADNPMNSLATYTRIGVGPTQITSSAVCHNKRLGGLQYPAHHPTQQSCCLPCQPNGNEDEFRHKEGKSGLAEGRKAGMVAGAACDSDAPSYADPDRRRVLAALSRNRLPAIQAFDMEGYFQRAWARRNTWKPTSRGNGLQGNSAGDQGCSVGVMGTNS